MEGIEHAVEVEEALSLRRLLWSHSSAHRKAADGVTTGGLLLRGLHQIYKNNIFTHTSVVFHVQLY